MKNYISVKQVKAEPCSAWEDCKGHKMGDAGYKIYYPDGYVSWCPSDIFEQQYLETEQIDKISQSDVDNFIDKVNSVQFNDKTTVTQATLKNGFVLTESSSCVDASNFDMKIGEQCCMEQIEHNVWFLLGFLLQSARYGFKQEDK